MRLRNSYWSTSAFADLIRGTKKLASGTSKEWHNWEHQSKRLYPVRHWIAEELLDIVQNIIFWPMDQIKDIKRYINYRWLTKTHMLKSRLRKGEWHELDTRILYCLFDELVDFVEIDQAYHHLRWDKAQRSKYNMPFWAHGWIPFYNWRCAQAGIDYLDWASNLVHDEEYCCDKPFYMQPTPQALAAQEQLELYTWWTKTRPARLDPYDASGWSTYCDRKRSHGIDLFSNDDVVDESQSRDILDRLNQMEQEYNQEDEDMLIRLIRIRSSLWT